MAHLEPRFVEISRVADGAAVCRQQADRRRRQRCAVGEHDPAGSRTTAMPAQERPILMCSTPTMEEARQAAEFLVAANRDVASSFTALPTLQFNRGQGLRSPMPTGLPSPRLRSLPRQRQRPKQTGNTRIPSVDLMIGTPEEGSSNGSSPPRRRALSRRSRSYRSSAPCLTTRRRRAPDCSPRRFCRHP